MKYLTVSLTLLAVIFTLQLSSDAQKSDAQKIAVIVHPSNDQKIDLNTLRRIWERSELKWKNGDSILPLDLSAKADLRGAFSKKVLGKSPNQMKEHYTKVRIKATAKPPQPKVLKSAKAVVMVVSKLKSAIGYMPLADAKQQKAVKIALELELK